MRKKSTRLLSAALAVCMMLSVLPVGAFAAEPGTEPENAVTAQEEAHTLPKNGGSITAGGTYTMEGGEYTGPITVNVEDGKDVIINITGDVTTNIRDMLIKVVKGHVTINGGDATVENMSGQTPPSYVNSIGYALIGLSGADDDTTVEINGGTYKKKAGAAVGCQRDSKGTLTIHNGTFETGRDGAVVNNAFEASAVMQIEEGTFIGPYALENHGTTIIKGGVFYGNYSVVYQCHGKLQINGGTFESMKPSNSIESAVIHIDDGSSITTITNGDFKNVQDSSCGNVVYYNSCMGEVEESALSITGGTFEINGENVNGICIGYSHGPVIIEDATIKVNASGKGAGIVRDNSSMNYVALTVKNVTIENDGSPEGFCDILLRNTTAPDYPVDLKITEDFTHKAVVDTYQYGEDCLQDLQVTTKTDTHYQKDLKLVSANQNYIIDYNNDDGTEYRYFNKREGGKYYVNPIHATMAVGDDVKRPYSQFVPGTEVTLNAFSNDGDKQFTGWKVEKIAADGVTEVRDLHDVLVPNSENPETATLTVPDYDVFVTAVYKYEGEIVDPGTGGDATGNIQGALSAVVVGAAAGVIAYEAGTGIYRVINMPGIPMPSNRIELAELLWEHAGKPEPVSTALYSDIEQGDTDAQKAAHWAVEQGLMKDDSEKNTFNPYFPVGKLRTCLTWNAAKEKGLFDKTEE